MRLLTREDAFEVAKLLEASNPEMAAQIRQRVKDFDDGKRDDINITIEGKITVEKFDGEYSPDKQPVETIVREGI